MEEWTNDKFTLVFTHVVMFLIGALLAIALFI
jgi:hypothetical protein